MTRFMQHPHIRQARCLFVYETPSDIRSIPGSVPTCAPPPGQVSRQDERVNNTMIRAASPGHVPVYPASSLIGKGMCPAHQLAHLKAHAFITLQDEYCRHAQDRSGLLSRSMWHGVVDKAAPLSRRIRGYIHSYPTR
jgi:hypothetical protein